MPEITEASKHIMIEETKQGLNIEIVDQDGRSMFPTAPRSRMSARASCIQKIAPALKAMPYRVSITGHTAASNVPAKPGYGPWELSADRANAVRQILPAEGCRPAMSSWWPARPTPSRCSRTTRHMAPNRRVTITLMREEPPLPADFKP